MTNDKDGGVTEHLRQAVDILLEGAALLPPEHPFPTEDQVKIGWMFDKIEDSMRMSRVHLAAALGEEHKYHSVAESLRIVESILMRGLDDIPPAHPFSKPEQKAVEAITAKLSNIMVRAAHHVWAALGGATRYEPVPGKHYRYQLIKPPEGEHTCEYENDDFSDCGKPATHFIRRDAGGFWLCDECCAEGFAEWEA